MKIEIECTDTQFNRLVNALRFALFMATGREFSGACSEWISSFDEGATFPADYDGPKVEIIREGNQ